MLSYMSRRAAPILLSDQECHTLQTWARSRIQPQRLVQRAQIILLAAEDCLQKIYQVGPVACAAGDVWLDLTAN
jgi:hypothetical protein